MNQRTTSITMTIFNLICLFSLCLPHNLVWSFPQSFVVKRNSRTCRPSAHQQPSDSVVTSSSDADKASAVAKDLSVENGTFITRRKASLSSIKFAGAALCPGIFQDTAVAAEAPTATTTSQQQQGSAVVVTDRVFFNVRISRQDGTFFVRDDLPDIPENRVYYGKLTFELFGKATPNHVAQFLQYVDNGFNPLDDNPLPSYARSSFPKFDQATGVLYGGTIPSLDVTELSGSSALRYGGRILPAKLWVDVPTTSTTMSHSATGLLTHRQLDVTPVFGLTTRRDTSTLDRSNTVFGRLKMDDDAKEFLQRVESLPTYSVDRPAALKDGSTNKVADDAAEVIFNAQRDLFRKAATSFGDTRIGKVYEGKILRRVEVTQVGIL